MTKSLDESFNISMQPIPGFDYNNGYPFIIVRDHEGYSLINLKDKEVQRFIDGDKTLHTSRFTFIGKARSGNAGFTFVFISILKNGTQRLGRMNLDFDFGATIKKIGGLPPDNMLETYSELL